MAHQSFWGRYDIRAVVGADFGPPQYRKIARAYAHYLKAHLPSRKTPYRVAVGHDARLHSPEMVAALCEGLLQEGVDVAFLGLVTSPVAYFSEYLHEMNPDFPDVQGAIMVTASHNPSEYNGVKFTFQKRTLEAHEFLALKETYEQLADSPIPAARRGEMSAHAILPDYLAWLEKHFGPVGQGVKVVVDSGNATAGIVAPEALRRLGCEVIDIFTEPDGRFPNHHPDPCVHKNLTFLIKKVLACGADFGVAFDGDSDRLGVVDERGRVMPGDLITLFLSEDVLAAYPGAIVAFDIKSTQALWRYIVERRGTPLLSPSGHAYMKRLMREKNIPLGGELSGHLFFRDRHWGFDDALYAACRLIETFNRHRRQDPAYVLSRFTDSLPPTLISEEVRIDCTGAQADQLIQSLEQTLNQEPDYLGSPVTGVLAIDGLRANIENGFFLVRRSGTEPCITLRFEAPNAEIYQQMERRIQEMRESLKALEAI